MKRSDTEAAIKAAEQKSNVLKETSEDLSRESLDLRSESFRLRTKSRKLLEEIKKNIPPKKATRSARVQKSTEEHDAAKTFG